MSDESLEEALKQTSLVNLCVGLVVVLAEQIESNHRVVLTSDADSLGGQFLEILRHVRSQML